MRFYHPDTIASRRARMTFGFPDRIEPIRTSNNAEIENVGEGVIS